MELNALVTGASSGIGKAISKLLISKGYRVFGIGRNFEEKIPGLEEIILDISDTELMIKTLGELIKNNKFSVLVNCAGSAYYGVHESLTPGMISEMCRVDLEAPMIITNMMLPSLRETKGTVINISSVTADRINTHGACYGALKAGLLSFGRSVFEEYRKHGVKVTTIKPDMTDTKLYRNADFKASEEEGAALSVEDVSNAVRFVLDNKDGFVPTEITLEPQFRRIEKKR